MTQDQSMPAVAPDALPVPDAAPDELYPAAAPVQSLIDVCSGGSFSHDSADSSVATVEFLEAAYRSVASGRDEMIGPEGA